jgi:hypothetical protein
MRRNRGSVRILAPIEGGSHSISCGIRHCLSAFARSSCRCRRLGARRRLPTLPERLLTAVADEPPLRTAGLLLLLDGVGALAARTGRCVVGRRHASRQLSTGGGRGHSTQGANAERITDDVRQRVCRTGHPAAALNLLSGRADEQSRERACYARVGVHLRGNGAARASFAGRAAGAAPPLDETRSGSAEHRPQRIVQEWKAEREPVALRAGRNGALAREQQRIGHVAEHQPQREGRRRHDGGPAEHAAE